ncbi:MAG: hypothetical protein R2939_13325 [Kofleriaceae bacterium]
MAAARFRFRPRYRGVAYSAVAVGAALAVAGAALGPLWLLGLAAGGALLGITYLRSPTWRLEVVVDDDALEVPGRFRLPWPEVVRVIDTPAAQACFVDGGTPARSLLVPGDGVPAPYTFDDRAGLYAAILAHVAPDRVEPAEPTPPT